MPNSKKNSIIAQSWQKSNSSPYLKHTRKGLNAKVVRLISQSKQEPDWMLNHRLKCLHLFQHMSLPKWGPDLSNLNLQDITYFAQASDKQAQTWDEVPQNIKDTFTQLGIPQAEQKLLAGVGAQYESTVIYHNLKKEFQSLGVIFEDMDVAVKKYPDLVRKYFMQVIAPGLHKFSALHGAVWSGGTFLYIPKNVVISKPLQAYFRMNARGMGQFEHTLIVVESNAQAHYIEGCSAPRYGANSLHAGCVEIIVKPHARFRYSSVESWSKDTYNLNTKRAMVDAGARMEWVGGNFGSQTTMLYPCSVLRGEGARADHLGIAFANTGQVQDTGAKVIHNASHTSSHIVMKSISRGGGASIYRGLVDVAPTARECISNIECDALLLDDYSTSETIPVMKIRNDSTVIAHEARAGKLSEEDIFYLTARGIKPDAAAELIVNGFADPVTRELPLEYAVEMNRMIELEMQGSVG